MFKNSVRKYSVKNIPYESRPVNKYNAQRSGFNLKPKPTQGLVHNPPASLPQARNTPKAFIPSNDPRLHKLGRFYKTYSKQELEDMPLIYGISKQRTYDITPEIVQQVVKLRNEDANKWTVSKLAQKFGISKQSANVITLSHKDRTEQVSKQVENLKKSWPESKLLSRNDRRKRVQMWLRNEF